MLPVLAITVNPLPQISLPADTVIAAGGSVQLHPSVSGAVASYQWTPAAGMSDPSGASPFASPDSTTTYQVPVTSDDGCIADARNLHLGDRLSGYPYR
jgi:hypothetical protein